MKNVFLILAGAVILFVCSQIAIPMVPVPITLQTLAVTVIGGLYGARLGAATIVFWLALGAIGLPVFAGGSGGFGHFAGPTGGYLIAFPIAGAVVGYLVARGWDQARPFLGFAAMLIGNLICLVVGASWLAVNTDLLYAIDNGLSPFLIGAVIKAGMGVGVLALAMRLWPSLRPGLSRLM